MKVGVVLFPGSNCAADIKTFFERRGDKCTYIWHKQNNINDFDIDLLVLPGGFAFGDREYKKATGNYVLNPGYMALNSPVIDLIKDARNRNIIIIGVCNGFQILTKMGLLPGKLELNNNQKFTNRSVECIVKSNILQDLNGKTFNIDVANSFGKYYVDENGLVNLIKNDQILLCYNDEYKNDNGSIYNIGGVCDETKKIFGLMPHFERQNTEDNYIYSIIKNVVDNNQRVILDDYNYLDNTNDTKNIDKQVKDLMFSEHISYKSTKKYLKKLYTLGEHVIQGPGENAGIVDIGDGYAGAIRVESHNHPTFIDPYNGASTGVGGILRDIFTMGA